MPHPPKEPALTAFCRPLDGAIHYAPRPNSKNAVPGPQIRPLACHPALPSPIPITLDVGVRLNREGLALSFRLEGSPGALRIPPPGPPEAADNLWRHTCCEAFVAPDQACGYREFNFSPSGQWAAYRFTDYRRRDFGFLPDEPLPIHFQPLASGFLLEASIPAGLLPPQASLRLGLSAIIEHTDGRKSYWALTHLAEQPDFHQPASFLFALNRP